MLCYPVYLEIAPDDTCMAHVLDLPGCTVRAPSRDEALRRLPEAIRDYHAWLRRHGEPAPPAEESIEIQVAGESTGFGPFDPGDPAALFPPDREPISPGEMERYFRLMAHARADLLDLVRDPSTGSGQALPEEVLDWQPDPQSFSIRRLLRHIGNAEQWYVSRLVPPETLPPEWEHDEGLPIFEFLEMERRTAVERLRQLTAEERSGVFYPSHWTDHPEEPWTARKVLRRFLEHEREHTAQVREILSSWRAHLLADLAVERIRLLEQITGLDEKTLSESPVFDDWTAKDLLAHVAFWDEFVTGRVRMILEGREGEIVGVDLDARNLAVHAERKDWPLAQAVEACVNARADFLATLARLSDEELHRQRHFPWGEASVRLWTGWRAMHDAEHAADLAAWRPTQDLESKAGPRASMLARLAAERAGLLEQLIGLDETALTEVPVLDDWTVKDLLAHIAVWDRWELREMKRMLGGEAPDRTAVRDMDAYNAAAVAAWRDRALAEVLVELQGARAALVVWLRALPEEEFFRRRLFDGEDWSFPGLLEIQWQHDAEHAAQIAAWRKATGLEGEAGPKPVLLLALTAAREELLAAAALMPAGERESRPVCGEWTLKDVLGHVADWEWVCVDGLRQMAAGRPPRMDYDVDAWNREHVEARRDQPWEAVWADFHAARRALLEILEGMSEAELGRSFPGLQGEEITAYYWVCNAFVHDRHHAQDLRNGGL